MIRLELLPIPEESLDRAFLDLWIQDFAACALSAADEVGIFIALEQGERSSHDLAELLRLDEQAVTMLCRALVAMDALELHQNTFLLSPFSRAFWIKRNPSYRGREFDRHRDWEQHQRIVATLDREWAPLHDGQKSFSESWRFGDLGKDPAISFTKVMHSMIFTPSQAAARSGALCGVRHLIDVGGGSGAFAASLIAHQPGTRATVMDLPPVCDASRQILSGIGTGAAVEYFPCNFFEDPWPGDADALWFSNILHDWPRETCARLLSLAFGCLPDGGHVFVHEALLNPDQCSPRTTALFSLLMYMNHRGQQFTREEVFDLLTEAGFRSPRVVHDYSYWSLVEARKG